MRSRNYFIPEIEVAGKVSLLPVLSKIISRKTKWLLGAELAAGRKTCVSVSQSILSSPFGIACSALVWKWPLDGRWIYLRRERKQWQIKWAASFLQHKTGGDGAPLGEPSLRTSVASSPATLCCAGPPSSRSQPASCAGKAGSALGMSLLLWCWWKTSPRAPALLTAAPSLALPSCFLLCLIYRKRSAASQSLPSSAIRTTRH